MDLKEFLIKNKNKDIVAVQGLGFVGAVMSLVVSNALEKDYAVIGVDLKENNDIINSINNGIFPIKSSDPKIEEFYQNSIKKENLLATYNLDAYSYASTIIVDVNLDVQKTSDNKGNLNSFDVDLSPFKKAIRTIGKYCKEDVLILVETTVPPGTCEMVVKPIIEEELSKRNLLIDKVKIGHSYERVMPGPEYINSIQNFYRVFSGINEYSADETEKFLKSIISTEQYPLTRLGNTNATEMAKVLENSYRAMNIAFVVEWSRYAEESGVNLYEVVDAIRMRPTHANLMYPGIGVGGYCLTKDPLLASWARINHFNGKENLKQSEKSVKINDKMPYYAFEYMKRAFDLTSIKDKKILILGVSYRSNVGDTRHSPVEPFYLSCLNEKALIETHDPYVENWDELNHKVSQNLDILLEKKWNVIVFSTAHSEYKDLKLISKLINMTNVMIYDTIGILNQVDIDQINLRNKVKVLGRGDI